MQWQISGVKLLDKLTSLLFATQKNPCRKSHPDQRKLLRLEHLEERQLLSVSPTFAEDDTATMISSSVFATTPYDQTSTSLLEALSAGPQSETLLVEEHLISSHVYASLAITDFILLEGLPVFDSHNSAAISVQESRGEESATAPRPYGPITYAEHLLLTGNWTDDTESSQYPMQTSCGGSDCSGGGGCDEGGGGGSSSTLRERYGIYGVVNNPECCGAGVAYLDYQEIETGIQQYDNGCCQWSYNCLDTTRIEFPSDTDFTQFTIINPNQNQDTYATIYRVATEPQNVLYFKGWSSVLHVVPVNDRVPEEDYTFDVTTTLLRNDGCFGVSEQLIGEYTVTIEDDDHWKASLVEVGESDGKIYEEGATSLYYEITRGTDDGDCKENEDNTGENGGDEDDSGCNKIDDLTYSISVRLVFGGTAVRNSDYHAYYKNANGNYTLVPSSGIVTIPATETDVEMKIQAYDDTLVERLEESITVTITDAYSTSGYATGYVYYTFDETAHEIKVVDNDTLDLQKVVFTNNLTNFYSDPDDSGATEAWGAGPHWLKGEMLHRTPWSYSGPAPTDGNNAPTAGYVPVAYSSQDALWAQAKWLGNVDPNIQNDLYVYFSAYVGGGDEVSTYVHLVRATDGSWVMDDASAKLLETFEEICGKTAIYDSNLTLQWRLYVGEEGASKTRNAGTSFSCLYVTYDTPTDISGPLYHSVVHIGCVAAQGQTTDQAVFNAIWSKFSGDNICLYSVTIENGAVTDSKSGNELYYYGRAATAPAGTTYSPVPPSTPQNTYSVARQHEIVTTAEFLRYKDGKCGAWQDFFCNVAMAQGISVEKVGIGVAGGAQGFAVKSGLGKHHGQTPKERSWGDHALIKYNDKYYDSSYGTAYGNLTETKAYLVANVFDKFYTTGWVTPSLTYFDIN